MNSEEKSLEPTLAQAVTLFLLHSRFLRGTDRWRKEVTAKLNLDFLPLLGECKFSALNQDLIYKFYLTLKARGLSNSTLHKYHDLFCLLGDVYADHWDRMENPARRIRRFRRDFPAKAPTRDINFLSDEELQALFAACAHSTFELAESFARFQASSGLRRAEAQALKWVDLDSKAGFLTVRNSKNGRSRRVPLDPPAWGALSPLKIRSRRRSTCTCSTAI